ncbi:class I SAM-dependent methyltransferase [Azospirillum doebereinerae]|uniref:Methyltransferase domain-containing protein n=1 Tax=Azospirillum doebereinerae TaxID=92933 RepID=A0A433JEH5_9PROT|nr:methyltransferase domain-containing protein [Azospirillum doebereinerae]RUQ75214.1 methyltransferase domain-containing protein [Azospirillum doebereinerae]
MTGDRSMASVGSAPFRTVLNVGCGPRSITRLHQHFPPRDWREVRLDADPEVEPDILAQLPRLSPVADASVDAVWASHSLEHLEEDAARIALEEFLRVLRPGGVAMIAVPDLQSVARILVEDRADEILYQSPLGPVRALDVVYGFAPLIAAGNTLMAHRTGFTGTRLKRFLEKAGFAAPVVYRLANHELFAIASRPAVGAAATAAVA